MYGLFSRKKKQIELSPLSGGSGPPNGGQDEVVVVVSLWRTTTTTTSSRPPFGGHDLQTMEIIRSVSSFEKNPYNVSSNLSLSRAHFSKVHVFCEVHGGRTGGRLGHGGCTLPIYSSSKLQLPSSGLIAHSVALSPLNWVVREVRGGHGGRFSTYMRLRTYMLHIL